jgi:metal-responsive CopG/Arc/MetJ family transcriptional regulator
MCSQCEYTKEVKEMKKKPVSEAPAPVVVRMPKKVVAALDKVAARNNRSRSGEVLNRVIQSLAAERV